jgi:hypothetical protein
MAGQLTLTTLSDGVNSTSATNAIQGSAKAWVNCNVNGVAVIRASYNVSSVTRNGTGDYTVNFTNAMVDINYCVSLAHQYFGTGDSGISPQIATYNGVSGTAATTTSSVRINTPYNGTLYDCNILCVSIIR